jgi:hypothetical protein
MTRTKLPSSLDLNGNLTVLDDTGNCRFCPSAATVYNVNRGDTNEPVVVHAGEACEGFKFHFGGKDPKNPRQKDRSGRILREPTKALDEKGWLGWEPSKQTKLPETKKDGEKNGSDENTGNE